MYGLATTNLGDIDGFVGKVGAAEYAGLLYLRDRSPFLIYQVLQRIEQVTIKMAPFAGSLKIGCVVAIARVVHFGVNARIPGDAQALPFGLCGRVPQSELTVRPRFG